MELDFKMIPAELVLSMVPTRWNSSGIGLELELNHCNGFQYRKTRTVSFGPFPYPNRQHLNLKSFALINCFSSDCIVTWSTCTMSSVRYTFISRSQMCDQTNICCDAFENPPIMRKMRAHFTATSRISVGLQIWIPEVKVLVKLQNVHIYHVLIRSELTYPIAANNVGTGMLKLWSGSMPAKNPRFYFWSGLSPSARYPARFACSVLTLTEGR